VVAPGTQAVDVRAALDGRDQVDVALGDGLVGIGRPAERELDRVGVLLALAGDRLGGQPLDLAELVREIGAEVAGEEPLVLLAGGLVVEAELQARTEHRLGLEHVAQLRHRELLGVEILGVGPEAHRGAGIALAGGADDLELRGDLAVLEADVVFLAAALDPALELLRERVDHRHADAVQAAGELVVVAVELAARVQAREDELDAAHLLLRVDVDRHAAAVVGHLERAVLVERDRDLLRVWPPSASSTLLSMTSCARWFGREVSVYMPGRRRTGSSPERTSIAEAS
jgi:hypothetical protein